MSRLNEANMVKCEHKLNTNLWLLGICFTLFTFIVAINPGLLRLNTYLSLQLTLAIPFLTSSIFARTKQAYSEKVHFWENYGFITFMIAYSFLVNSVGILLSTLISIPVSMAFFSVSIGSAIVYSSLEVIEDRIKLAPRIYKDFLFISIVVFLGILPSLGIY
jgi:hypothetical protein